MPPSSYSTSSGDSWGKYSPCTYQNPTPWTSEGWRRQALGITLLYWQKYRCLIKLGLLALNGLRDMCMIRLGLLPLNGHRCGVFNIFIGSVCNIGRRIVGRQPLWWEGMLTLDLHKIGAACTSQHFASLTYYVWGWMTYLIEARWVSRVHFCGSTCGNNCSRIDLHHFLHTHHDFHHSGHFLFHGLHVGLHLLLHLLYFTHYSNSSTRSVRVP